MVRSYKNISPSIENTAYIDPQCTVIGDVYIGADSSIWPGAVIRGDMHSIRIGARTSIQDNSVLHITHKSEHNPNGNPLEIGDDVTIGHKVTLHGCTVHNQCIIGIDSTVLDGAIIEENTILAAGSVVPPKKVLESGFLWMGAPAQKKRPLTPEETTFILYSANNYVKLKNDYLNE